MAQSLLNLSSQSSYEYSSSWPDNSQNFVNDENVYNNGVKQNPQLRRNPFDDDLSNTFPIERDCCSLYDRNSPNLRQTLTGTFCSDSQLMESHFEEPLAHIGRKSSVKELEKAIADCKRMFLSEVDNAARRRLILDRLIELRQDLQYVKDRRSDTSATTTRDVHRIAGHEFVLTRSPRFWNRCELCLYMVYGSRFYFCRCCSMVCHPGLCADKLRRHCPIAALSSESWKQFRKNSSPRENDSAQLDLDSVVLGGNLASQNFKCADCHTDLVTSGSDVDSSQLRLCHYTHKFYCHRCHWADKWPIPGNIFLMNDTGAHPVCRTAYLKLSTLWSKSLFRVPDFWNREFFNAFQVFSIRLSIYKMQPYLKLCPKVKVIKSTIEEGEPHYLLEQPFSLSMKDVMDIIDGSMVIRLQKYANEFTNHIYNCELCKSVNKLCSLCQSDYPVYTFDPEVLYCPDCASYYHRKCHGQLVNSPDSIDRNVTCSLCVPND